jgi:hypothetical protein
MLSQLLIAPRTRTKRGNCESFPLKYDGAVVTDKNVMTAVDCSKDNNKQRLA